MPVTLPLCRGKAAHSEAGSGPSPKVTTSFAAPGSSHRLNISGLHYDCEAKLTPTTLSPRSNRIGPEPACNQRNVDSSIAAFVICCGIPRGPWGEFRSGKSPTPTGNNPHPLPLDTRNPLEIPSKRPFCLLASPLPLKDGEQSRHQRGIHMKRQIGVRALLGSAMALTMCAAGGAHSREVSHHWRSTRPASPSAARRTSMRTRRRRPRVRVTRAQLAGARRRARTSGTNVAEARRVEAFEIAIPAATLTSPKEGLDKNMHKALKVDGAPGHHVPPARASSRPEPPARCAASACCKIAGVEREVALDLKTAAQGRRRSP